MHGCIHGFMHGCTVVWVYGGMDVCILCMDYTHIYICCKDVIGLFWFTHDDSWWCTSSACWCLYEYHGRASKRRTPPRVLGGHQVCVIVPRQIKDNSWNHETHNVNKGIIVNIWFDIIWRYVEKCSNHEFESRCVKKTLKYLIHLEPAWLSFPLTFISQLFIQDCFLPSVEVYASPKFHLRLGHLKVTPGKAVCYGQIAANWHTCRWIMNWKRWFSIVLLDYKSVNFTSLRFECVWKWRFC